MQANLKQRIVTAVVAVPVMIAAVLFLPTLQFSLLLALFILGGAWEWTRLIGIENSLWRVSYVLFIMASLFLLLRFGQPVTVWLLLAATGWWLLAWLMVVRHEKKGVAPFANTLLQCVAGWLVLVPAWFALVSLHGGIPHGGWMVLGLFSLIWMADIAAYFAGRRFGKNKLAPRVSPGKTREGMYGALLASGLLSLLLAQLLGLSWLSLLIFLALALLTVVVSILGDLLESLYKRTAGLKDSGTILPGHGGILDRIDSLTAAAPVFVLGYQFSGQFL